MGSSWLPLFLGDRYFLGVAVGVVAGVVEGEVSGDEDISLDEASLSLTLPLLLVLTAACDDCERREGLGSVGERTKGRLTPIL